MPKDKKVWQGRFKKEMDKDADIFNASVSFDKRLFKYDVAAGAAHAKTLAKAGIIPAKELARILAGLKKVLKSGDKIDFCKYEDVHSAVEGELVKAIGDLGKKIHTARSRNDLVATDTRLYLKDEIKAVKKNLKEVLTAVVALAKTNINTWMPSYTHMQHAQIISCAQWLMSYFFMFSRDCETLGFAEKRADSMPLGSGALAGVNYKLDRAYTAKLLGFAKPAENSIDAVSDRDFLLDFLYFASVCATHLSRFCEEIIIYNTSEFGFIEIDDAFATGSSIMPHKKNPDIAELIRGKAGIHYGNLMAALAMLKALPLAYNKDMQEDKKILFKSVDELKSSLHIFSKLLANIKVKKEKMLAQVKDSFMYAVDVADYLVGKGVPFREAHEITGNIVSYCLKEKKQLSDMFLYELLKFSKLFEKDIYGALEPEASLNAKGTTGSTSIKSINSQLAKAAVLLKGIK